MSSRSSFSIVFFFFFNDTATTEIYTLSLHDALPISCTALRYTGTTTAPTCTPTAPATRDRKSTRLNSSHLVISYAVFCLKKKNKPSFLIGHVRFSHPALMICTHGILSSAARTYYTHA